MWKAFCPKNAGSCKQWKFFHIENVACQQDVLVRCKPSVLLPPVLVSAGVFLQRACAFRQPTRWNGSLGSSISEFTCWLWAEGDTLALESITDINLATSSRMLWVPTLHQPLTRKWASPNSAWLTCTKVIALRWGIYGAVWARMVETSGRLSVIVKNEIMKPISSINDEVKNTSSHF